MKSALRSGKWNCALRSGKRLAIALSAVLSMLAIGLTADEPFARSKDYDLQHSKIVLKFDVEQKKIIGDVTHTVTILREDTSKLAFDSVGLTIESVTVNKKAAKFETAPAKLIVPLASAAKILSRVTPFSLRSRAAGERPVSDAIAMSRCSVLTYSSFRCSASASARSVTSFSRGERDG